MNTDRFEMILSIATEGFWDWDLTADQAYLSPRYCELIGYYPEDTVFDAAFLKRLVHPDDHAQVFALLDEHFQGKRDTSVVEHRIITRNGTVLWVEGRAKVVEYDNQGKPTRLMGTITDISVRKQAEIDRMKSEEEFRLTFEEASDAIFWADAASGMLINCNKAAEEMMEAPRSEIIGRHQTYLHPPEMAGRFADQFRTTVELKDQMDSAEAVVLSKSGRRIPVQIKHAVTSVGGRDIIQGLFRDVSEQKQVEEELRHSHNLLNNLSQQVPGALFQSIITPDGRIFTPYSSEKLYDVYELRPDQIRLGNTPIFDRFHPDDRDRVLASITDATNAITRWECEYRVILPIQGLKWLHGMALPVRLDDGTVVFYGIITDITERKKIEESLSQSQKLLSSIVGNATFAIFVKDISDEYRIILWNRAAEEIFCIPAADILGKNAHDLWPKEQADSFLADDRAVAASQLPTIIPEEVSIHPDKGDIYLRTRKIPLVDAAGNSTHIVVICEDITDRRMMMAEMVKNQKLESLGILAGGIAHDFNNILTAIVGNISFARTFLDETHRSAKILHNAEKAAHRASDLAHQLLTFAKGSQPIKKTVSVRHILEESASFVLRGSNVSCSIRLPDSLPAVEVDENQISQVINNIIINASQAMPGGGTVVITGEQVLIDAGNIMSLPPGRYVRITLADNGCGISKEDQKRVFDPYFTTKPGGSGLGLASAHSIILKHGGYIGVQSEVGKGTTFTILLPASDKQAGQSSCAISTEIRDDTRGSSILVMDDEEMILDMISLMLGELGYQVRTCSCGEEAVALYRQAWENGTPYSTAIMDLTIPGGMGGKEAARHMLEINPYARLIVSSGYSTDPIMADYAAFGFCATLLKPYTIEDITGTLATVLAGAQPDV